MNVLDLFSGIGGFSLGLERAGMRTVAFCEIEPFQRAVLAKHWPGVPIYNDVRELTIDRLRADGIAVDVICGGFPCQDISVAGRRAGIEGERSGLWKEYARIIGEVGPRYVIVENVAALLNRGLDVVLGDLAALGYDAEWHCIPASAVGAPHRRDRLWLVAYPNSDRVRQQSIGERWRGDATVPQSNGSPEPLADSRREYGERWPDVRAGDGQPNRQGHADRQEAIGPAERCGPDVADTNSGDEYGGSRPLQVGWGRFASQATSDGNAGRTQWGAEPDVGRVAHGVPNRVDRLTGLGNAVVPQIPEIIGRAIMNSLSHMDAMREGSQ